MQVSTTFRHMDASQAVREYAEDRLEKIRKYFHRDPLSAHAVFSVERGYNHVADLSITLPNGILIKAKETTEDMYSSIDLATARIERQIRRWKDKIRDHKPHGGPDTEVRQTVFSAESVEPQGLRVPVPGQPAMPDAAALQIQNLQIIEERNFVARPMRVEDAVMQLNLRGNDFLVFTNIDNRNVAILYRRSDGNYGLIDTGPRPASS